MYKEARRKTKLFAKSSRFSESNIEFKPNSYFIRGGLDLEGDELDSSAQVFYDTEEELSEVMQPLAQGSITAAAISNPKIGFMEIAETLGIENAELAVEAVKRKDKVESD